MNYRSQLLMALLTSFLFGCASITSTEDTDGKSTGIRYYNSAPFILAYSDGKGGIHAELVHLPDTTRIMSMEATAFFAQNKTVMKFEKSVLTSSDTEADATEVPKAIIEAAKGIATASITANKANEGKEFLVPAPYLYRVHYGVDPDDRANYIWQLVGGQAVSRDGSELQGIHTTFVRAIE